jgi:Fur family ferric uptake transcriptional regulator
LYKIQNAINLQLLFDEVTNFMQQKRYRSKGSQLIEQFGKAHKDQSFSAGEIVDYVKSEGLNVNTATIYRSLDRMSEDGLLLKFKPQDSDSVVYQYKGLHQHCDHHMHMRCRQCGKLIHLECEFAAAFIKKIEEEYGFTIEPTITSLGGLCSNCKSTKS